MPWFSRTPATGALAGMLAARATQVPENGLVERVLDIGVSAGATTTSLRRLHPAAEVWGVDISPAMIRYAHMRAAAQECEVHFRQMNAEYMDFPDEHFDIALAMLVFHELPVPASRNIIAEVYRVLKPRGVFTDRDATS